MGRKRSAYLRTHPCDVVFTDLHMDQMGGQQLIAACTQERIPVRMVIISAYSDFSAAREGLRSGVVDYLFKPITRKDMGSSYGAAKRRSSARTAFFAHGAPTRHRKRLSRMPRAELG